MTYLWLCKSKSINRGLVAWLQQIMLISLLLFFVLCCTRFRKCSGTYLSAKEQEEVNDAFESFFQKAEVSKLFRRQPYYRNAIITTAMTKYFSDRRQEFMDDVGWCYGILKIILRDYNDLQPYLDPVYKLNFNRYFDREFIHLYIYSISLLPARQYFFDQSACTPLQVAVALNRQDIIKQMVEAKTDPKIELDMVHRDNENVSARAIARKIYSPRDREKVLQLLTIDKNKHNFSRIKSILKNELDITVKEAVLSNDFKKVEAALYLGNFGDKNDVEIIRWAMLNENFMIFEALVMEGYKIPEKSDRPLVCSMNSDDVDYLLNQDEDYIRPIYYNSLI